MPKGKIFPLLNCPSTSAAAAAAFNKPPDLGSKGMRSPRGRPGTRNDDGNHRDVSWKIPWKSPSSSG